MKTMELQKGVFKKQMTKRQMRSRKKKSKWKKGGGGIFWDKKV